MKKKEEKSLWKIVLKFAVILILCFVGGYFTGVCARRLENTGINFFGWFDSIKPISAYLILVISALLIIIELIYSIYHINKSKKIFKTWDGEDENVIRTAEFGVDKCLYLSNIIMVIEMFLCAAEIVCVDYLEKEIGFFDVYIVCVFLFGFIILTFVQRALVQEEKKMNPEKKGEVLEFGFQKEWIESCDEAQKIMIGKAAFKAFVATNVVCMGLWLVGIIGILSFDFGIVPIAFVTIIWLTLMISFQNSGRKLEYGDLMKK